LFVCSLGHMFSGVLSHECDHCEIRSSLTTLQRAQFEVLVKQMRAMEALEKQEYRDRARIGIGVISSRPAIATGLAPRAAAADSELNVCVHRRPSRARHAR
jgi:hypothetical protein